MFSTLSLIGCASPRLPTFTECAALLRYFGIRAVIVDLQASAATITQPSSNTTGSSSTGKGSTFSSSGASADVSAASTGSNSVMGKVVRTVMSAADKALCSNGCNSDDEDQHQHQHLYPDEEDGSYSGGKRSFSSVSNHNNQCVENEGGVGGGGGEKQQHQQYRQYAEEQQRKYNHGKSRLNQTSTAISVGVSVGANAAVDEDERRRQRKQQLVQEMSSRLYSWAHRYFQQQNVLPVELLPSVAF